MLNNITCISGLHTTVIGVFSDRDYLERGYNCGDL